MRQNLFSQDRSKQLIKNLYKTSLLLLFLFIILSIFVVQEPEWLMAIDDGILNWLNSIRNDQLNNIFLAITSLADRNTQTVFTIVVVVALVLMRKIKTGLWYGLTELLGAEFINDFFKEMFERPRPDFIEHLVSESSYAFPSGHAMGSLIMYGGFVFILSRELSLQKNIRNILFAIAGVVIFAVGFSRLYLGVHYPTDVLGGFLLGGAWLTFSIAIYLQFIVKETRRSIF